MTLSRRSGAVGRIVSYSTLVSRINAARKAVGESGEEQRLIRTISRKGIRFVGEVQSAGACRDHLRKPVIAAMPELGQFSNKQAHLVNISSIFGIVAPPFHQMVLRRGS